MDGLAQPQSLTGDDAGRSAVLKQRSLLWKRDKQTSDGRPGELANLAAVEVAALDGWLCGRYGGSGIVLVSDV